MKITLEIGWHCKLSQMPELVGSPQEALAARDPYNYLAYLEIAAAALRQFVLDYSAEAKKDENAT